MDWKNFDIDGWNCMVDRSTGTVFAFSQDGKKKVECNALDKEWFGMSDTLDTIMQCATLKMAYVS